jgi:hypothetical protein
MASIRRIDASGFDPDSFEDPSRNSLNADWARATASEPYDAPRAAITWRPGKPVQTTIATMAAGAIGGVVFLFVARAVAALHPGGIDVVALAGHAAERVIPGGDLLQSAVVLALSAGAVFGAFAGLLALRVTRIVPRILFFAILVPAVWILLQAFVIRPLAPWTVDGLPFAPFLAGSLAYAVCIALVRPIGAVDVKIPKRRRVLDEDDDDEEPVRLVIRR